MAFNIFLSIFLILQFFYLFVITLGIASKLIQVEKQIQSIDKVVKTQTEIMQVQNNFLESFLRSTLVAEREAASKDKKKKKED